MSASVVASSGVAVNSATDMASPAVNKLVSEYLSRERGADVWSGSALAVRTVALLRRVVSDETAWRSADQLVSLLESAGRRIGSCLPDVPAAHAPVLRLLKLTRELLQSAATAAGGLFGQARPPAPTSPPQPSAASSASAAAVGDPSAALRDDLLASLDEIQNELENGLESIARDAATHIHADDVVLTAGSCPIVTRLLLEASRSRSFHVLLADCAPFSGCEAAARRLCGSGGPQVTVIADSAVFALMSRVNKVVLGAHTVLADGGVRAFCGARVIALAARHHSVPVIVCAPSYQLSPQFHRWGRRETVARLVSPEQVLPYAGEVGVERAAVSAPLFDYVPPELVTLFVTQTGGVSPWYVHRLLNDYYDPRDYDMFRM